MIYGSTKTKLDYIVENGFMRIDAAIEGVIAKYPTVTPEQLDLDAALLVLRNSAEIMRSSKAAQREYNNRLYIMAQQASLAPQPDWLQGRGAQQDFSQPRQNQFPNQGAGVGGLGGLGKCRGFV